MRETIDRLQRVGFSEIEARTYCAVLRLGEATARELADETDVSKPYIYDIVDELDSRGVVTVNDQITPTKIQPRSPSDALADLRDELETLDNSLESLYVDSNSRRPEVEVIKTRQTTSQRLQRMIEDAQRRVLCCLPHRTFQRISDVFADAVERGVFVLLLLSHYELDQAVDGEASGCASVVRTWEEAASIIVVSDDGSAVLGDPSLLYGQHRPEDFALSMTQNAKIVDAACALHANIWVSAPQSVVTARDTLPTTYESFQKAVLQAALFFQEDIPLDITATVTGPDSDGGAPTELSGRLVDVRQSIVDPTTAAFAGKDTLLARVDGDVVSLGGPKSFIETYQAHEIRLHHPD